jgi:hypothetical protein
MKTKTLTPLMIGLFCLFNLVTGFAQGALQEEPDPQRDLIRELRTSQDLKNLPVTDHEYRTPESAEVILAAYEQLGRALTHLQATLETDGVEPIFPQLELLNQVLVQWSDFWKRFAFVPQSSTIRAQEIRLFYQQISVIDQQITQSILAINDLINQERVLTSVGFQFPE